MGIGAACFPSTKRDTVNIGISPGAAYPEAVISARNIEITWDARADKLPNKPKIPAPYRRIWHGAPIPYYSKKKPTTFLFLR